MNFIREIFGTKNKPIESYKDFWDWFSKNERDFYNVVQKGTNFEKGFFNKLSPKLNELREGYYFLSGMYDENTAELIITADGNIKNIVFVEELINSAPKIPGWRFTALKPALNIENVAIEMDKYVFDSENLFFYSNDNFEYPDEINLSIVHLECNQENKSIITNGTYIFLDNYLGEIDFINNIDKINFIGKNEAEKELIPIEKLKDFLIWRQKEFIEKYDGIRHDTENDTYSSFEAKLKNGKPLIAIFNSTLLEWDSKASHPWILKIEIKYNGEENNGFPDDITYKLLDEIENTIMSQLNDFDGYLNIGRETADSIREIYFACKDYRKPSKVLEEIIPRYSSYLDIEYEIFKDKYWQSLERFI